jgi:hypothetical protein
MVTARWILGWLALLGTVLIYLVALSEVLPPYADLPPCHFMFMLWMGGVFTLALWRERPQVRSPSQHQECGENLTHGPVERSLESGRPEEPGPADPPENLA